MLQLVIVADDLTGAADTGASFAAAGFSTVIPLTSGAIPDAEVVVLSTESRDMSATEAALAVSSAIAGVRAGRSIPSRASSPSETLLFYKKIDSALRGHPRAELLAAMEATGARRALVAPAFPAEGRTTIGGRQQIGGVPVAASGIDGAGVVSDLVAMFGRVQGLPVRLLDLVTLRGRPDVLRRFLQDEADGILVADAETDDDLMTLARAVGGERLPLFCGSAGFARQLARALPLSRSAHPRPEVEPGSDPILVVAGSQHEATTGQIEVLAEAGVPIVRPEQALIDNLETPVDAVVQRVAMHLAAGRSTVLTTLGLAPCPLGGHLVAGRLGHIVAAPEVSHQVGGLVLTGGDVAKAVCSALNATALWLEGEITPGIPWGVLEGGRLHAHPIATKAGSFGDGNALHSCLAHLKSEALPALTPPL